MGSPTVQRWPVTLSAYEYNIVYKPGKQHVNADELSRLLMSETASDNEMTEQVLMMDVLEDVLVDPTQMNGWTAQDVILSQVQEYILIGWPGQADVYFKPYLQRKLNWVGGMAACFGGPE